MLIAFNSNFSIIQSNFFLKEEEIVETTPIFVYLSSLKA
jgi:hypothetical protein